MRKLFYLMTFLILFMFIFINCDPTNDGGDSGDGGDDPPEKGFYEDFEDGITIDSWNDLYTTTGSFYSSDNVPGSSYKKVTDEYAYAGTKSLKMRVGISKQIIVLDVEVGPEGADLSFYHKEVFENAPLSQFHLAFYDNATNTDVSSAVEAWESTGDWSVFNYTLEEGTHELMWKVWTNSGLGAMAYLDEVLIEGDAYVIKPKGEISVKYCGIDLPYEGETFDVKTMPDNTLSPEGTNVNLNVKNTYKYLYISDITINSSDSEFTIAYNPFDEENFGLGYNETADIVLNLNAPVGTDYSIDLTMTNNDGYDSFNESSYSFVLTADTTSTAVFSEDFDTSNGDWSGLNSSNNWELDHNDGGGLTISEDPHLQDTYSRSNYAVQFGQIDNDDGIDDILYLHDGYGSIKIDENLQSLVDLTTDGGTITFWYKLDCDTMDNLEFEISRNGSSFDDPAGWTHIGGQTDWKQATIRLIPGTFNLEWAYDKDDAISHYSDTVWIDDIIVVANQ